MSISCAASDAGSGLADAGDAAFDLETSVPDGAETGSAATGSRSVCDNAGNCTTAGPIGPNKVDRRAPALALPANRVVNATSPAGAVVAYAVAASDGADPSPRASCSPASGGVFPIGRTTVSCTATDHVGNRATQGFGVIVKGAKEQLGELVGKVVSASRLSPAVKSVLLTRLQSLLASLDPNRAAHRRAFCLALQLFKTAAQAQAGRSIPQAQAAEWIADANRIRAVLGC